MVNFLRCVVSLGVTTTRISETTLSKRGITLIIRVIVPDGEPDSPPPLSEQATLTHGGTIVTTE